MMRKEAVTCQTKNDFYIAKRHSDTTEDLSGRQPSSMAPAAVVLSEEDDIFPNMASSARVSVVKTLVDALKVIK